MISGIEEKIKKGLKREQKFMKMTDEEKIKYIEKCDKVIEGLGGVHPEDILYMLKISDEERQRRTEEYMKKSLGEEKYKKFKKELEKDRKKNHRIGRHYPLISG